MTETERALWMRLRDRRLSGLRFVRQEPIGPYIVDFCCREHRLIVELDGSQHAESEHDQRRDAWIAAQGYRIVRIWNVDWYRNPRSVLDTILSAAGLPV